MAQIVELSLEPYIHLPDSRLSEGVTYMAKARNLLWVDIFRGEIHKVTDIDNPASSHDFIAISSENYRGKYPCDAAYPERVGVVFPIETEEGVDKVLFASKYGIGITEFSTKSWEYLVLYSSCEKLSRKDFSRLRTNDGNVAPNGELYVGLMNDFHVGVDTSKPAEGCLLRINIPERKVQLVLDQVYIPNSINWNQDKSIMYLTDSLNFTIWSIPYADNAPDLDAKHKFAEFKGLNKEFESPEPDGSVVDFRDGLLYSAVWSTHKVQCFDALGNLVKELVFPDAARISCCCIGADGDLFVTTGNLNVENGGGEDKGGCLYRVSSSFVSGQGTVISSKGQPLV